MFHKIDGRRVQSLKVTLLLHTQRSGDFAFAVVGLFPLWLSHVVDVGFEMLLVV